MLESNAVERVVQLDVHAEVVRVELELVAGADAGVLVHVERQRRDPPVDAQAPVPIALGRGVEDDQAGPGRRVGS